MLQRLKTIGPGAMVAAAFIGPGTVTTATIAGSGFGYTLLWAVLFSIGATLVLQEMTARLAISGGRGLGEALREKTRETPWWLPTATLVIAAIFVGNAAYEAGNLSGAALGATLLIGAEFKLGILLVLAGIAFFLLSRGTPQLLERALITMVAIMGLVFVTTAIITKPPLLEIARGLVTPTLPDSSLLMVAGLIGTTVVPYNLFLHASILKAKSCNHVDLPSARFDIVFSVVVGGLITMAIVVSAAAVFNSGDGPIRSAIELSVQLKPLLGDWSGAFMAIGLLAAGLSSSITAPLAAAFAVSELFAWQRNDYRFRLAWIAVLTCGVLFASLDVQPTQLILLAQVANAILLPVIALFIVWVMNDRDLLRSATNNLVSNLLGCSVIAITIMLSLRSLGMATGWL
tara:strand:+ start:1415 stop:2620 length:1206 start_codon:yes stop_codon:yes gene_type:complete